MQPKSLEFDGSHHIIIYDDHLGRPIAFLQKGVWYAVEGECSKCGACCNPECRELNGKRCKVHWRKPKGCAHYPSGTPDQYSGNMRTALETVCSLKIRRLV